MHVCVCVCVLCIGNTSNQFSMHLNVFSEAFKGGNIKAFFAGLQTGDNLLGFDTSCSDCQTREAAMEILREPRTGNLPT